ncbi:flagellar hook-basal body complex protein FliE [Lachnospiraceae bacterium JLR.KK009]|jgi:flagellar hook-basal body complex protein FliE|nr:flagellar hook-basal body complex protein FliE [Lachnospiraceae bacterium A2]MCI8707249.1 flagellar hook-basal body complex protein FliE [Lachnospiraceae bacterium]MCI8881829.1 flagellar hook-basal body complex protein FliE [Lachnospiraceae bacterium]
MDISVLSNVSSDYIKNAALESGRLEGKDKGFDSLLKSAMGMVNEASDLQNQAEEAEVQFMLGYATNTHDLQAIQEKADIALNYTIAVRDRMIESYKEIMNMQI